MTSLTRAQSRAVKSAFAAGGLDTARFRYWAKPGPPTPLRRFRSPDSVLTVAVTSAGRSRITVERECRQWAAEQGIPVPTVRAAAEDDSWFVADYITAGDPRGSRYVIEGLRVADLISRCTAPHLTAAPANWRGSRRTLPSRVTRQTRGGLSLPRLRRARAAAHSLPDRTLTHGDYYRRNVLADSPSVQVVDWEFIGDAPRFTDHLRLWSTLLDPADRRTAWTAITAPLDGEQRQHVAVLGEYLVLRLLGENLAAPTRQRDAVDLNHARAMVRQWPDYLSQLLDR